MVKHFKGVKKYKSFQVLHYNCKKHFSIVNYPDKFKKAIKRYKIVGYSMDIMQKSVCLVVNPITTSLIALWDWPGIRLNDDPYLKLPSVG